MSHNTAGQSETRKFETFPSHSAIRLIRMEATVVLIYRTQYASQRAMRVNVQSMRHEFKVSIKPVLFVM